MAALPLSSASTCSEDASITAQHIPLLLLEMYSSARDVCSKSSVKARFSRFAVDPSQSHRHKFTRVKPSAVQLWGRAQPRRTHSSRGGTALLSHRRRHDRVTRPRREAVSRARLLHVSVVKMFVCCTDAPKLNRWGA